MREPGSALRGRCRHKRSEARAGPPSLPAPPRAEENREGARVKKPAGEKVACLTYLGLRAAAPTLGEGGEVCRPAEGRRRGGEQAMSAITSFHRPVSQPPSRSDACDHDAGRSGRMMERGDIRPALPSPQGLDDPAVDKDSCGVAFIADIKGRRPHPPLPGALTIV